MVGGRPKGHRQKGMVGSGWAGGGLNHARIGPGVGRAGCMGAGFLGTIKWGQGKGQAKGVGVSPSHQRTGQVCVCVVGRDSVVAGRKRAGGKGLQCFLCKHGAWWHTSEPTPN